ncbi:MAG: GNAT family N-acetyltransferase [Dokdonella sp.]
MNESTHPAFEIRPATREDNAAIAAIIRSVMPEFGADGPGFAIHDAEVDCMFETYARPRSAFFVVEHNDRVIGGAGIAPLENGDPDICELRKMYFLRELRGLGAGKAVIERCLGAARGFGFRACYLETLNGMNAAQALYSRMGFQRIEKPLGNTGHFSCDRYYTIDLLQS